VLHLLQGGLPCSQFVLDVVLKTEASSRFIQKIELTSRVAKRVSNSLQSSLSLKHSFSKVLRPNELAETGLPGKQTVVIADARRARDPRIPQLV
jgi:hypothetical protein